MQLELDFEHLYPEKSSLLLNKWKLFEEFIMEPLKQKCKTQLSKTKFDELPSLSTGMSQKLI